MITVVCDQSGDRAEAADEITALVAARTLLEDAYGAHPFQGFKPTASFYLDELLERPIRRCVTRQTIWSAIGASR